MFRGRVGRGARNCHSRLGGDRRGDGRVPSRVGILGRDHRIGCRARWWCRRVGRRWWRRRRVSSWLGRRWRVRCWIRWRRGISGRLWRCRRIRCRLGWRRWIRSRTRGRRGICGRIRRRQGISSRVVTRWRRRVSSRAVNWRWLPRY
jgi:hypothetical protein